MFAAFDLKRIISIEKKTRIQVATKCYVTPPKLVVCLYILTFFDFDRINPEP